MIRLHGTDLRWRFFFVGSLSCRESTRPFVEGRKVRPRSGVKD
jgi:hypothetical protein